jgi:hypothetical protein
MEQAEWLTMTCVVALLQFNLLRADKLEIGQVFFESRYTQEEVVTPSDRIGT